MFVLAAQVWNLKYQDMVACARECAKNKGFEDTSVYREGIIERESNRGKVKELERVANNEEIIYRVASC